MRDALLSWIIDVYLKKGKNRYFEEGALRKLVLKLNKLLDEKNKVDFDEAINSLLRESYIGKLEGSSRYYVKGAKLSQEFSELEMLLGKETLEELSSTIAYEVARSSANVNVSGVVVGVRCQVCGRKAMNPVTRKTCCVNKLYVFCSEKCLRRWKQNWLRRQI
jgi:hypothetical protein